MIRACLKKVLRVSITRARSFVHKERLPPKLASRVMAGPIASRPLVVTCLRYERELCGKSFDHSTEVGSWKLGLAVVFDNIVVAAGLGSGLSC